LHRRQADNHDEGKINTITILALSADARAGLGQEEANDGHLKEEFECLTFTLSVSAAQHIHVV
jgi:hypothetical protein